MACQPEDAGGLDGYFEFLEAVINTQHEAHNTLAEWYGSDFDPIDFDVTDTHLRLQHIRC